MVNFARKFLIILVTLCFYMVFNSEKTQAASQDACAIWLCLPGGFPSGCEAAHSEFRKRIKKAKPPLPPLASCTTGPNGGSSNGHYELGVEVYEPCNEGYVLREYKQPGSYRITSSSCYKSTCAPDQNANVEYYACESYTAIKRPKPNFVKMWVDGEYLGQYFYQ